MTENDIIRQLRRDPKLRLNCKALGEFVILVATARMTWLISKENQREMERSFSPHVIELAKLDVADYLVALVQQSSIYPPVAGT